MEKAVPHFYWKEPASRQAVENRERLIRTEFPKEYKEFLCSSNGCYGFLKNERYIILYAVEDVESADPEDVENIIIIGSDGGGEAVAFDTKSEDFPIVLVPFIGMEREQILPLAKNFSELLTYFPNRPS
jgi:hypothetical protein